MRTFSIQTLGCKVNSYESDQLSALLLRHGLAPADEATADLRIINTCSVTMQAGKQSRQTIRRNTKSPAKVIVIGCYATSDTSQVQSIPGVDAVITHHQNLQEEITRLLAAWSPSMLACGEQSRTAVSRPLPILGQQSHRQRAYLKIQDGCDAHCTYCIIPQLRPTLSSKSIDDTITEARALVAAGHKEIILTGIFLGAYGHQTALRRRQSIPSPGLSRAEPRGIPGEGKGEGLSALIAALCENVPELHRLRLSSLEPGDVTPALVDVMKSHKQIVPHFHLPLQSGSDPILRKMNRQYTRSHFREMIAMLQENFDRPALTTDIIVGFPGETDHEFDQTLEIAREAKFIHIHAFPFSPRPGTAAARWTKDFIHGPIVNQRIDRLTTLAAEHSYEFRKSFAGEQVEIMIEHIDHPQIRHGRCERYFDVTIENAPNLRAGDLVRVQIDRVSPSRTFGALTPSPGTPEEGKGEGLSQHSVLSTQHFFNVPLPVLSTSQTC